jgi:hypothetical protein
MADSEQAAVDDSSADSLEAADDSADREFSYDEVGATAISCLTYIEILVLDEDDQPISGEKYKLQLSNGSVQEGTLGEDGRLYIDSIPRGTCRLTLARMLEHGVPAAEVKRSWDWDATQGEMPSVDGREGEDS